MTTFDSEYLIRLLREGEPDRVEFKQSLRGSAGDSIREAICAFSNDLPGHDEPGMVFVGVEDDGSVSGLAITDELLRQLADMKTDGNTVPPPSMTVEKRTICGSDVAVIIVQPSDSPPVRCRGRIHVRTGPRRGIATTQDERILNERRRHGDIPFDLSTKPSSRLSDLNLPLFEHEYLARAFAPEVLEANERTIQEQLAATKMITSVDDPTPTVLGILTLGTKPHDFLPGAYVQFLRLNGTDLADDVIDNQTIVGAVADVTRRLDDKLDAHNRVAVDFTSDRLERRTSLYPIPAIQQITRNAIMHRAYEATNAPVQVHLFDDRIEVISPGGPYGAVTADSFGRPGIVDYRNPNLAGAMKTLGLVQRFGLGLTTARRYLRQEGFPDLEFYFPGNHVFVTVRTKQK